MHRIEASILVNAPVEECYKRWCEFERFPEFMPRVVSVRKVPVEALTDTMRDRADGDPQKAYVDTMAAQIVREVIENGGEVWHWEVRGPLNQIYSWDAGIVYRESGKAISWSTTHEEELATSGTVNFLRQPKDNRTLIEVKLSFSPPAAPFGELVADLLRYGDDLVYEGLKDFKCHMEGSCLFDEDDTEDVLRNEDQLRKQVGTPPDNPLLKAKRGITELSAG